MNATSVLLRSRRRFVYRRFVPNQFAFAFPLGRFVFTVRYCKEDKTRCRKGRKCLNDLWADKHIFPKVDKTVCE